MRIIYLNTSHPADIHSLWHTYGAIKDSDVVVVANEESMLSQTSALIILYVMRLSMPIVFYRPPRFSPGIFPFLKETILKRLNKMLVANINTLDAEDANILLTNSTPINYTLTRREIILSHSYTLSQLKKALAVASPSDLSPYPELTALLPPQPSSS